MSSPTTRQAYQDIYAILDRVLTTPNGVRIKVEDHDKATFLRMRIHQARKIRREDNEKIYSPGDPMYAASPYDKFQVRIRVERDEESGEPLHAWVLIEPRTADILGIELIEPPSNMESLEWQEPNFPPTLTSPSGIEPSPKRLEYSSSVPSDVPSLAPSTKPEPEPPIPGLRRL